jgi:hypothetical protein
MNDTDYHHAERIRRFERFPEWMRLAALNEPIVYAIIRGYAEGHSTMSFQETMEHVIRELMNLTAHYRKELIRMHSVKTEYAIYVNDATGHPWKMESPTTLVPKPSNT